MPRHEESRILPYSPREMFDLVADIERYPEFLPWCMAARVTKREGNIVWADLIVGNRVIREKFSSRVTLDPPDEGEEAETGRIDVTYISGPMRHMENRWIFRPHPEGTQVEFFVSFEFASRLLGTMIRSIFTEAVRRMVAAFEKRAKALYGSSDG